MFTLEAAPPQIKHAPQQITGGLLWLLLNIRGVGRVQHSMVNRNRAESLGAKYRFSQEYIGLYDLI